MRTIETKVYTFEELTPEAKQKAIENYKDTYHDDFYTEYVYEDAAILADIMGLDICQTLKTRSDKSTHYAPTIYYSGFWSQGDGACFEGEYRYKPGALKALKAHAPQDKELHRICKVLQDAQRVNFYKVSATIKHRGYYYHAGCMDIELSHDDDRYRDIKNEDDFIQAFRDFADWIHSQIESAYEYENSDEQITETLIANEYEFTFEGGMLSRN